MKSLGVLIIFLQVLYAQGYTFDEERYSNALERSIKLQGEIYFEDENLYIEYVKESKTIKYTDGSVHYFEDKDEVRIDDEVRAKLAHYFEILLLLHKNEETEIKRHFNITKKNDSLRLTPKGTLQRYIKALSIRKENNELSEVKLFLQNDDSIRIIIGNAIR